MRINDLDPLCPHLTVFAYTAASLQYDCQSLLSGSAYLWSRLLSQFQIQPARKLTVSGLYQNEPNVMNFFETHIAGMNSCGISAMST